MRRKSKPAPLTTASPVRTSSAPKEVRPRNPLVFEADVDGSRVRITARDEVVIECGQASITLRRNGRVVIRGTYVESASSGTNRVKGGQVRVN
jgi:plasmid replication initiation protein